jgi:RNA polymerase sigma factor (sigma-70 family)
MSSEELEEYFQRCDNIALLFCGHNKGYRLYLQDAQQEARLACWKISQKYDPSKGDFWAFAVKRVRGSVIDYFRQIKVIGRSDSPSYTFRSIESDKLTLPYVLPEDPAPTLDAARWLSALNMRWRMIAIRYYIEEETMLSIANSLGVTERRISALLSKIKKKLKTSSTG